MKIKKIFVTLFLVLALIRIENMGVLAMATGFSTENMESERQQRFLSNIGLYVTEIPPEKNMIECFDVNEDGMIALGSQNSNEKTVSIYKRDGTFQYAYHFTCNGSFGIEWDDSNVIIYFVRSDVAASFDRHGANIEICEIPNTIENNSYWNHSVFSTQRTVGDKQYEMKANRGILGFFATSYSRIIENDGNGNTTVLYDVSSEATVRIAVILIGVVLFATFAVYMIVLELKKQQDIWKKMQ